MFTRLDLPMSHDSEAAAIIDAVVAGHDPHYHLTRLEFAGGLITMAGNEIEVGRRVRLRLAARDVSLTLEQQHDTSILNIFPATVDELSADGSAQIMVRLLAGDARLLSRVTRKSADDLGLAPGRKVYAQVKSVALLN